MKTLALVTIALAIIFGAFKVGFEKSMENVNAKTYSMEEMYNYTQGSK